MVVLIAALSRIHPDPKTARPQRGRAVMSFRERAMKAEKIKTLATVQTGLVLNRKEARNPEEPQWHYRRISLRSLGDDGLLKTEDLDCFISNEQLGQTVLTQPDDIVVRLFAPIMPILIRGSDVGFVIPSQLAVIRVMNTETILPAYLRWFLSLPEVTDRLLASEGIQIQRAIRISTLAELEIPVPPLQKQHLIAQINDIRIRREKLYSELVRQENLYTNIQIQRIVGGKEE